MRARLFSSRLTALFLALSCVGLSSSVQGQDREDASLPIPAPSARVEALKAEAVAGVESRRELTQQMVDMIFSFSELGFQEFET